MPIRHIIKYFFYTRPSFKPPTQYAAPYDITKATPDEQIIMRSLGARTPLEARLLMQKYKAASWAELLPRLPKRKTRTMEDRLYLLYKRITGASDNNPYRGTRARLRTSHHRLPAPPRRWSARYDR